MPDKLAFLPSNFVFKSNTPQPEGRQQRFFFFLTCHEENSISAEIFIVSLYKA